MVSTDSGRCSPSAGYDWSKIAGKDPIRFNCRDDALQLLSRPQLVEDISFADPLPSLPATVSTSATFRVEDSALAVAEANYNGAFKEEKQLRSLLLDETGKQADAAATSKAISATFSGLAFWPNLVLDETDPSTLVVSRGRNGEAQKSHWQTVLQLLSNEPLAVKPGDGIALTFDAKIDKDVKAAAKYKLGGAIKAAA